MTEARANFRARLDAWRSRGDDHRNPSRFALLDAMEKRLAQHQGKAQAMLEARLNALMDAYACDRTEEPSDGCAPSASPSRGALGQMLDQWQAGRALSPASAGEFASSAAGYPELPLLHQVRAVWTRMRTEHRLQESLQPTASDAGPLNSATLVHRSLTLMHEISPGYLQHFVVYVDALSSLDRMRDANSPPKSETARPTRRSTPRKRVARS